MNCPSPLRPGVQRAVWAGVALIGATTLLGCGSGTPAPESKVKEPPEWAQHIGLSTDDPRSSSGSDHEMSYHTGDDDEDVEPIDFPSCEQAQEEHALNAPGVDEGGPPDLTADQYGAILNRGAYLDACHVDRTSDVSLCAAVVDGRAAGVTIELHPHDQRVVNCLIEVLRDMSFPAHPRMDVTRTRFAGR